MKKAIYLMLAAILLLGLFGCSNEENPKESTKKAIDFFGFKADTKYYYNSSGSVYTGMIHYFDYLDVEKNIYQRRTVTESDTFIELFNYINGAVLCNMADYQQPYFYDISSDKFSSELTLLKEPIVLGTKWSRGEFYSGEKVDDEDVVITMETEITGIDVEIDGYKTIELTTSYSNNDVLKEYLAEGFGLVKNEFTTAADGNVQTTNFESIVENTAFKMPFKFFYPGTEIGEQLYEEQVFEMNTNADTKSILEKGMKTFQNYSAKAIINETAVINAISFSHEGRVKIDFNEQPITGFDLVAEQALMKSIVNTVGFMFGAENVCITVNGQGYASENFQLLSDEYMEAYTYEELGMTYEENFDFMVRMAELNAK